MMNLDEELINRLEALLQVCFAQIGHIEWQPGDSDPIGGRLLFISLQHCLAATHLLRAGLDASASALIRSCADCGARSIYAVLCASKDEIEAFKADKSFPFARRFENMVDLIRSALYARPDLPFAEEHIDPLFATTAGHYSVFSSFAHGGMTPVSWIMSDEAGVMQARFPAAIRCLSAIILGETVTQASMVHLALHGLTADLNLLIAKQRDLSTPRYNNESLRMLKPGRHSKAKIAAVGLRATTAKSACGLRCFCWEAIARRSWRGEQDVMSTFVLICRSRPV